VTGSRTQPWHPYVFDAEHRSFVGDFESMYRAEATRGFDSWHQSDPRRLDSRIAMLLLQQVTFRTAVDLGCGKGTFTAALRRRDNEVVGVDVSETAVAAAQAQFPDLRWVSSPVADYLEHTPPVDLVVAREILSYLPDWRDLLARSATLTRYLLVGLYLPPDPIGFVKSHAELEAEIDRHFELLDSVILGRRRLGMYLAAARASPATRR
jgi:SAM-dependent methyltransferase